MLIYLASPYSHIDPLERENRYNKVLEFTKRLIIRHRLIIYSPIVHNHYIEIEEKFAFDFWEIYDTKMISRCDELWVYQIEGWKESSGIAAEIKIAASLSIKVRYIEENQERFNFL